MKNGPYVNKLLETAKNFEIEKYQGINKTNRQKFAIFEGTPKKHPVDENILILFTSPFSDNKKFYEFSID